MDATVLEFIDYLNKFSLDISAYSLFKSITNPNYSNDVLISEYNDAYMRVNTINFLEQENLSNELLLDFNNLSKLLKKSDFNTRERIKIILYCMQKNIQNGLLDVKNYIYTDEKISHYDFKYFSKESAKKFLDSEECSILLGINSNNLIKISNESLLRKQEIEDFLEKEKCYITDSFNPVIEMHRTFESIYFKKDGNITAEDFNTLVLALKKVNMEEEIINNFIYVLSKKVVVVKEDNIRKKESKHLNSHDLNELYNELKKYFIPSKKQVLKVLSFEEQVYCVRLLMKLNFKEYEINEFLRLSNKYNKQNLDTLAYYNYLYPKITLLDNQGIQQKINNINECITEMFISSDDDYEQWKNLINEELIEIIDLIPNNYELEMKKAKTL